MAPIGQHFMYIPRGAREEGSSEPPPPPLPVESQSLLGNPEFDSASPTWWNGTPITGVALDAFHGLHWWANPSNWGNHANLSNPGDGSLGAIAARDDLYHLGRTLRDRVQCILIALTLTGDLRFLDTLVGVMNITKNQLRTGYRNHDSSVVTWSASPFLCWVNVGGGFGADVNGTDLVTMNEVKWHATIAQVTYALYVNRDLTSPGGHNYNTEYNYWINYLTNHFLPKWRGGGTSSWRDTYRGVRRTPTYSRPHGRAGEGQWPVAVNGGEGHSSLSSTQLAYYMWKLTGEQTARDEFEWMTNGWLTVDGRVINDGTHFIYHHTSPVQGSTATYAQRSAYVNYNQTDIILGRILNHWPERINDELLTQMANSFNDYFLVSNFTSLTSTSSRGTLGDIIGNVARGGLTSSPDAGRLMSQLQHGSYFAIARWSESHTKNCLAHLEGFSSSGTRLQPRFCTMNTARLLEHAPLS